MVAQNRVEVVVLNGNHSTLKSIFIDGRAPTTGWLKQKLSRRNLKKPPKQTTSEEREIKRLQYNNHIQRIRERQYPMLNGENSIITTYRDKH